MTFQQRAPLTDNPLSVGFATTPTFVEIQELLDHWYLCPTCGKVSLGWYYNWEYPNQREFALGCKHRFTTEYDFPTLDREIMHHELLELFVRFETKQPDGTITQRLSQRSDSYLGNMAAFLGTLDNQVGAAATNLFGTVTSGTGTVVTATTAENPSAAAGNGSGTANAANQGMYVGTGNTANSADTPGTCALATPIANGIAANQLQWGSDAQQPPTLSVSTYSYQHQKTWTNNSPTNPIGITEVGNVWKATSNVCYVIRDVLGATVNLANGGASTTGTYVIGITVS